MLELIFFQKPFLKKCFISMNVNKFEITDLKKKIQNVINLNVQSTFIKKNYLFHLNIRKNNFFMYMDFLLLISFKYWYKFEFNIKFNQSSKMFFIISHAKELFFF